MINYSLKERVNPQAPLDPRKHYAFVQNQGAVNLRQLATRISRESTISMMDTMAVLEALLQVIPDLLADGKIVRLGELGTFRVTISSEGADTTDDFNVSMIKGLNLKFRPGAEFRDQLARVKFTRVNGD
jgi:predicted histone-like DNA-binding protein